MFHSRSQWPGLGLALGVAVAAMAAARLIPLPVSSILVAILTGLALSALPGHHPGLQPGLKLASGRLLKLGVILIGLRLSLIDIGRIGIDALPLVALAIPVGLGSIWLLGRLAGIPRRLGWLLAAGTGICGASAIAATAPGIRARPEETAYAMACIALFGLSATLIYPPLFHTLLGDAATVGMGLGAAIHDTAQVTGAALLYDQASGTDTALPAAAVTKLLRNLTMLAVIPGIIWLANRDRDADDGETGVAFPLFVLGFLALAGVRTAVDGLRPDSPPAWETIIHGAKLASEFLFASAMAALGMSLKPAALKTLGWRPAAVALGGAVLMGAVAIAWLGWIA